MADSDLTSDDQLLDDCRAAVGKARRAKRVDDGWCELPLDDHAHEVWLRARKMPQDGGPVSNRDGWLFRIAANVLNDVFRRLKTSRDPDRQRNIARDDCQTAPGCAEAVRRFAGLLGELSPRDRLTLEYYRRNDIDFPNNNRTVLDEHAGDLGISKLALTQSLSRICKVAAELQPNLADDATPPFSFNEDDFLTLQPRLDDHGQLSLTIGLPATLSEPDSRKAPERKLLEETVFRRLLPASVAYVLSGCPQNSELDETLTSLRNATAGLAATRFEIVRCQTLQLLARLSLDSSRHEIRAGVDELLAEIRESVQTETVRTSPRAIELYATLHELEGRSSQAVPQPANA